MKELEPFLFVPVQRVRMINGLICPWFSFWLWLPLNNKIKIVQMLILNDSWKAVLSPSAHSFWPTICC